MSREERRHLEMMAATIAAGMEAQGDWEGIKIAAYAVKRARAIQELVLEIQANKEQSGA